MANFFKVLLIILVVIAAAAILFLVAIPAFMNMDRRAAPTNVPVVSSLATSTAFVEGSKVYANIKYGYQFEYPIGKTVYERESNSGLIKATTQSSVVNIARDESKPTLPESEIFSVVVYPDVSSASDWFTEYYPNKSEVKGNKIFLYEGYPARDILGAGSTTSPARIVVVEKDGYIVTIEQSIDSPFLRSIFSRFEFVGSGGSVYLRSRDSDTHSDGAHQEEDHTSTANEPHIVIRKTHRFPDFGITFAAPREYRVSRVSIDSAGNARTSSNGALILVSPPDVEVKCCSPQALLITLDQRTGSARDWYQAFYLAKNSVKSVRDFTFQGRPAREIIGAGRLDSPYRTTIIENDGIVLVTLQIIDNNTLQSVVSSINFVD